MKKWIITLTACLLLPAMTACGVNGAVKEDSVRAARIQKSTEKSREAETSESSREAETSESSAPEGQWLQSAEREYGSDGELTWSVETWYDSFGNPTSVTYMEGETSLFTYEYDEEGRIITETRTRREPNQRADIEGSVIRREYDKNGNLIRETESYLEADTPWKEVFYEYDRYGNCTCETTYMFDKLTGQVETEYEYDKKGRMTAKTVSWHEPENWDSEELEYTGYARYEYDAEGREVKYESFNRDGELRQATEHRYDEKGRLLYEMSGNYQDYQDEHYEDVQTRDYEYDDEHSLYSIIIYWDGRLYLNGTVSLNENGDEVKRTFNTYDDEGRVYLYTEEYTYDEDGNRIRVDYYDGRDDEYTHDEFDYVFIPESGK